MLVFWNGARTGSTDGLIKNLQPWKGSQERITTSLLFKHVFNSSMWQYNWNLSLIYIAKFQRQIKNLPYSFPFTGDRFDLKINRLDNIPMIFRIFFSRKDSPLEREWKKNPTISEFFTRFSGRGKSSLRDYRIKNILDYEKKEKKKEKIVEVKTKGRADERKRERGKRALFREGGSSANRWPAKTRGRREQEKAPDERIRPALERKNVTVIRPQGEEKLAVAASHWPEPRRRRSERSPIPVRLDEPLERERPVSFSLSPFSPPLALPLATPHFILYSLRSAAPLPSLRTGPGKLPRTIFRNGKIFSLGLENTRRGIDSIKLGVTFSRGKR